MRRIVPLWFIRYKFVNSLFLGLSVGAIFTLYAPLEPSIYSVGGIALAVGMLIVARLYHTLMNAQWLFRISLSVEILLMMVMLYFLVHPYTYQTALLIYVGYQLTFVFGSYLVRVETLLLKTDVLLTKLDTAKQLGYLVGMGAAYLFYKLLEGYGLSTNQEKVYMLHYLLVIVEIVVIGLIFKSFQKEVVCKNNL